MVFQKRFWLISLTALALLASCGKKEKQEEETSGAMEQMSAPIDPATVATVTGKVMFDGPAPRMPKIKMSADAVCAAAHPSAPSVETVVLNSNGTLANVFVYVKEGLEGRKFDVPTEAVTLDQHGCMYKPHVFGLRVGQPLKVLNSDPTLHNIHALPVKNTGFNMAQAVKGMENTKTFDKPEIMVKFKCDVHSWMACYAGVVNHPFFAVTGEDGSFSLKGLPPGKYVIEAWQEDLGTQTMEVTVGEKETKDISFTFKPKQAS